MAKIWRNRITNPVPRSPLVTWLGTAQTPHPGTGSPHYRLSNLPAKTTPEESSAQTVQEKEDNLETNLIDVKTRDIDGVICLHVDDTVHGGTARVADINTPSAEYASARANHGDLIHVNVSTRG